MSSEIFSQSDIDALLGGVSSLGAAQGSTAAPAAGDETTAPANTRLRSADVQLYDFRRPNRVSKDKLRALEAMYERLAKSLEGWLIGRLRGQVEVNLQGVEQLSFGEFILSLPSPCASFLVDVDDSGGQQAVIDLDLGFAYYVVDRLFGGNGDPVTLDRALSSIERKAVRMVAERIKVLLAETWQDHIALDLNLAGFESVPEILQAANREDPVLVCILEVRTGAVEGLIGICVPFVALEKFFSGQGNRRIKNPSGSTREVEMARQVTETLLRETEIPVSARLPEFRLPMHQLAALEVGSVVATGVPCGAELEVWVGDEQRLRALPGRNGKMLALQILHPLPALPPAGDSSIPQGQEP